MNKEDSVKVINQIENYLLYIVIFLLPVLVVGIFSNKYIPVKFLITAWGIGLILITKAIKNILRGQFGISSARYDFPVLLLWGAYILSAYKNTPNKMEAFFLPGTATAITLGVLLYFIVNQLEPKIKSNLKIVIFASAVFTSLITLLATAGILKAIPQLPEFMKATTFNTVGSSLDVIILMALSLPAAVMLFMKEKDIAVKSLIGTAIALVVFSFMVALFNSLPSKQSSLRLPGFNTSWIVSVETLKNKPILGIGPGNYLTAFNLYRPLSYNNTDLWQVRFTSARSYLLTSFTETGLIGLAALVLIYYSFFVKAKKSIKNLDELSSYASIGLTLLAMAFFPIGAVLIIIFFLYLAISSKTEEMGLSTMYSKGQSKLPFLILYTPLIITIFVVFFYTTKVARAEYFYQQALNAVAVNDGRASYDTLRKAINTNPYVDRYRITYSQINLALANSIAANPNITDQDKQNITQLIQQAIREGKVAVSLNPQRSSNWEVLARIYQSIAPLAENANSFAAQSFQQAIALDPINPNLRITQGGIFYAAKDYQSAANIFTLAVSAKPDLANAHFNLSFAYQELGMLEDAIKQMSIVLSLVEKGSNDYEVAQKALTDMQEKAKAQVPETQPDTLTAPQEGPEAVLEPQIELPEEAAPPQPEASSTPAPTPESSPTPAPEQ